MQHATGQVKQSIDHVHIDECNEIDPKNEILTGPVGRDRCE